MRRLIWRVFLSRGGFWIFVVCCLILFPACSGFALPILGGFDVCGLCILVFYVRVCVWFRNSGILVGATHLGFSLPRVVIPGLGIWYLTLFLFVWNWIWHIWYFRGFAFDAFGVLVGVCCLCLYRSVFGFG